MPSSQPSSQPSFHTELRTSGDFVYDCKFRPWQEEYLKREVALRSFAGSSAPFQPVTKNVEAIPTFLYALHSSLEVLEM